MWNYRVIEFVDPKEGPWQAIHEVYYDDEGRPEGYTENPADLVAFDDSGELRDLRWILDRMREALDKPVLVERDFIKTPHNPPTPEDRPAPETTKPRE